MGIPGWRALQSIAIRLLGMLRMLVKDAATTSATWFETPPSGYGGLLTMRV
jgi:hypothetical protein